MLKDQAVKIFWITVGWTLISILQFVSAYITLVEVKCDLSGIDPALPFEGSILTGILAGLFGGSGVVFLWGKWLRTQGYGWALARIFLSYTLIYFMVSIPSGLFYHSRFEGLSLLDGKLWNNVFLDHFRISHVFSYMFWLLVVLGTLIILLVNDKYGPGVFRAFLMGKYFHPRREERIFMFLDLRSSTAIAETLGEERYFNFIKDVFTFVTPAILQAKGEIYQYVGDEIIISWRMENGIENANCLLCFFEIQEKLRQKADYFQKNYQTIPEFKAGLHYGDVMAGEIGVIKRDIAFSGDVLNTAARIQAKCNDLGVDILLSRLLVEKLRLPAFSFVPKKIGDIELRGKDQRVALFTV